MGAFLESRKPRWLFASIALAALLALAVNVLLRRSGAALARTDAVPQGWGFVEVIVVPVWIVLLSGLAVAAVRLVVRGGGADAAGSAGSAGRSGAAVRTGAAGPAGAGAHGSAWLILALFAFCVLYEPTFGRSVETGLVGNVLCVALAAWVGARVLGTSTIGAASSFLIAAWAAVATVYLVKVLQLRP